ncbi:signal transduction histidine kinase/ligand-binding sensor domain-containing protein/DNA-binding response OmpR family regulator [Wenyingzhuangia heitensis]|uniref:histidine kinase n=1 Tax=Wenyingzhuangia heitensis TaxID=1487859 RepID=A0ABX0UAV3_9FLAO|nr:hybrid sensor histidine kinase/response regulator transcription factor [Wenyingzhuangia heitensis]NIJ45944.1 signal transduction histidine kinase/ligand-binding sensor domain-containing protein/DNA-binding response OmpR family regulator [Wenyingzhuangia heitensis]
MFKNYLRQFHILSLFVFLISTFCYAQQNVIFSHLSVKDGLSQSDINTIHQTKNGYLWFGTHNGLNKYDGYKFTHYKPSNKPNSISSNLVFRLTGDNDNNLWIGTTGGGLNYFDSKTEKFTNYLHSKKSNNSVKSNYITSVYHDSKNRLWIGTKEGLDMVDCNKPTSKDSIVFNHISLPENHLIKNKSVTTIYESKSGELYVGTIYSLYKLTDLNNYIEFEFYKDKTKPRTNQIKQITEDSNNRLIVASSNGMFIEKKGTRKLKKFFSGPCVSISIDAKNQIWVATQNGLLCFRNDDKHKIPELINTYINNPKNPNSISKNIVTSLYKDITGILWIGTNGGGINKLDPQRKKFNHVTQTSNPNSISNDKVRAILEDSNKTLWIGTEGGGLNYQKNNYNSTNPFLQIPKASTRPIVLKEFKTINKKLLLIGGANPPNLSFIDITNPNSNYNTKPIKIKAVTNAVFAITVDHLNNIWVGTYNLGVFLLKYENGQFKIHKNFYNTGNKNQISNNIIRNIFQDSHKNMWFATGKGLSKLPYSEIEKENPKFRSYTHNPKNKNSLSYDYILSIHETKKGELWIGTFGGGLNKLISDPTKEHAKFKSYTDDDGLPNNVIKGILEDDSGNLWLSSNMGLTKFNPEQSTFKNYNTYDGLQSNEFQELACYKKEDGEMFFGGINGFNSFYPENIKDNPHAPQTLITKISLFNKKIQVGKDYNGNILLKNSINNTSRIEFKHNQNSISFEFTGIQYSSPQKNQYAYKLSGFEEKWNYTNSTMRFATYTNLSPGIYTFSVKSSNGDGIWNDSPKKIVIEITPPFWKTIWAYIIYVLIVIGLLIAFWRFTLIRTEQKHELELETIEKEKYEELQQMKMEFFTNISHEFRTPLTLIKGPLEYLQTKIGLLDENVVKHQYQLMDKNTDYLLRLVTQLLDFQKMDKGQMGLTIYHKNIARFIKEIAEPFRFISEKKKIKYTIRTEEEKIYAYFSPDALEKVMNNLLSNAFKFCPENGTVDVYVYIKKTYHSEKLTKKSVYNKLVIEVRDSGFGITDSKKQRIFNRFYSNSAKELANPTGTGIGLSYTKSLVDLHQGTIFVVDNEWGGSTFAVNLPLDKQAYLDKPNIELGTETDNVNTTTAYVSSSHQVSVQDQEKDEQMIGKRSELPIVLVVDDNKDIRSFIKQSLKDKYNILEAENGLKGYELAKKQVPNIIISDYVMPEMDGAEFCKKCKETSEISHVPFILLTAKTSQDNQFVGLESGADDYITKPFNLELLQLKIKNIIGKRDSLRKRFNQEIILKPEDVTVTSADEIFLEKAMEVVEKNMMNTEFSVEMLVKEMSVSRSNLYLKLKEITGLSSSEFIRSIRLKRAVQLLEKSDLSVKEIMYMTGFNSPSYFAKCFKKQFNMTPSDYINKNNLGVNEE